MLCTGTRHGFPSNIARSFHVGTMMFLRLALSHLDMTYAGSSKGISSRPNPHVVIALDTVLMLELNG